MERPFHYPESENPYTRDNIQKEFLNGLIEDFSKAKFHKAKNAYYEILCEKFRKETDYTTMFNPNRKFDLSDAIARQVDIAKSLLGVKESDSTLGVKESDSTCQE